MNVEYGFALVDVGQLYLNLTVETTCAEQGFVQYLGSVGGGQNYYAAVAAKAVYALGTLLFRADAQRQLAKAAAVLDALPAAEGESY